MVLALNVPQLLYAQSLDIGNIALRFCNDTTDTDISDNKVLSLETEAGTSESVCMTITNNGSADASVKLTFVDGTITDDTEQKKACAPEGTKTRFGQYVSIPDDTVQIKAGESVTTTATLTFPDGYAGAVLGCVTTQLASETPTTVGMFDIQTRKANFIEVVVDGEITSSLEIADTTIAWVNNLTNSKKISVYPHPDQKNAYKATLQLKNTGTIWQDATVTITLTDMLWKQYTSSQDTFVPAGESRDVHQSITDIPVYKGSFTVEAIVTYMPKVEFETAALDDADTAEKTLTETTSFVVIPRLLVSGLLIVIVLLRILMRKKNNKHWSSSATDWHQQQ